MTRYRTRRREREPYPVGVCRLCTAVVRLGPDFRVLAHNPPDEPVHRTCMGSYLLPVTGTVEYVTEGGHDVPA